MRILNNTISISCFLIILFSLNVIAQSETPRQEVDRLMNEIKESMKAKDFEKMIAPSTRILELFPNSGDVYAGRGLAYLQTGKPTQALSDFDRALTLPLSSSMEITSHRMSGLILYNTKMYERAMPHYDFLIKKEPQDFRPYMLRGWCFFYTGKHSEAVLDFSKGLEIGPKEPGVRRFRAVSYFELGKFELAVNDISDELIMNPKASPEVFLIRAKAYRKLGKDNLADADEKRHAELQSQKK